MNPANLLYVGLGGLLGSVLRYLVGIATRSASFPLATFTVNIIGSFIIGCMFGLASKHQLTTDNKWWLFIVTGICGGFTTFSAFSLEALQLLQQNKFGTFTLYIAGSLIAGIAATYTGYLLSR